MFFLIQHDVAYYKIGDLHVLLHFIFKKNLFEQFYIVTTFKICIYFRENVSCTKH